MLPADYMDKKRESKGGAKVGENRQVFPHKISPDWDIFWGKQLYSCKVDVARNMAGPFLELQVAGRLGVKTVKLK